MPLTVAIVGRPNVGKSTLFNRLAGKRLALVDDTPGVTRDWRSAPGHLGDLDLIVVDTAGLEDVTDDSLEARMRRQTERAIDRADVVLLVVDARAGITPLDQHFAAWIRKGKTPVVLVANKVEGRVAAQGLLEVYELGLGAAVAISAEHGEGLGDLFDALAPFQARAEKAEMAVEDDPEDADPSGHDRAAADEDDAAVPFGDRTDLPQDDAGRLIQLAIVGRPNVGKSTLLNALVGEERVLTGPEAGMTRDAISVEWEYRGRPIRLVDTAGLRRRARIDDKLEKLAVSDALRVIRMAQVVVLVMDAEAILDKQDLTIARLVIDEGRALVIAVNKWDAVTDRAAALGHLRDRLETSLPQVRGLPTVTISALKQQKLDDLLDAVLSIYDTWNRRVPTAQLNRWLADAAASHPPPLIEGRRVRLRYMTQVKARPPTFAIWINKPVALPESYLRYLTHGLRDNFGLEGTPIRILPRKGKNPYSDD
ncbi:MAG: ribosome biogenesis GTPase Der [Azospirillaceae bacterium]|nr:ribosome biogenesis GTPase Der [Azospirillaceae bacterium]